MTSRPEEAPADEDVVAGKLARLPPSPGCYVFLDREKKALYVGKAKSLRSRVRSYFQPSASDSRWFIDRLPYEIGDLETLVTQNEQEAALLENALIKERQPRYNFKLRDDKEFLSIRIDTREDWPRLRVVRKPAQDGARYFGPYDSATAARRTMRLANRYFRLRTCTDSDFAARHLNNWVWMTFTRSNPAADVHGVGAFTQQKHWGCSGPLVIDARIKPHHAPPLEEDSAVSKRVEALAAPGGPLHGLF